MRIGLVNKQRSFWGIRSVKKIRKNRKKGGGNRVFVTPPTVHECCIGLQSCPKWWQWRQQHDPYQTNHLTLALIRKLILF